MPSRPAHRLISLALGLAAAACSNGSHSQAELARAEIGLSGGEVRIDQGPLAGLVLTIPAGALPAATQVRIVPAASVAAPGTAPVSTLPSPGTPFAIEPRNLELLAPATLRLPFRPEALFGRTGPGNVRIRQRSVTNTWDREPQQIDVGQRYLTTYLLVGGSLEVVAGPVVDSMLDYLPTLSSTAVIEGGLEVVSEPHTDPRFQPRQFQRLRLRENGQDQQAWWLEGGMFVGRQSFVDDWLEMWLGVGQGPGLFPYTSGWLYSPWFQANVYQPAANALPIGSQVRLRSGFSFPPPIEIAGTRYLDVLELSIEVEWNRGSLALQRQQFVVWLAPGTGVLALQQDGGPLRRRTTP